MNLVSWLQRLMTNFGAGWVMWLLVVLSVISVAVMLERAWVYWSLRDNLAKLAHDLRDRLRANDLDGAKKRMESSPSAEAAVVCAGLLEADRGTKAAEEAMLGARALQRIKLERRLAFLGTLGNNAPFIGLFGTVIGGAAVAVADEDDDDQQLTTTTTTTTTSGTPIATLPCEPKILTSNGATYYLCEGQFYVQAYGDSGLVYMPVAPPR